MNFDLFCIDNAHVIYRKIWYIVFSRLISPLFVPSIFHSHPLLSFSYCRNLKWINKVTCVLVFTCIAVHCARYVYSSWRFQTVLCHIHLQVPQPAAHRPDTWSESLTVEWNMYDKLMLSTDCCMYNQYSTAWLVTNETTDISAVEMILVMRLD